MTETVGKSIGESIGARPLSLSDRATLGGVLADCGARLCDFCFALLHAWAPSYGTAWGRTDAGLAIAAVDPESGAPFFEIPYEGETFLAVLEDLLAASDGEIKIRSVTEENALLVAEKYGERATLLQNGAEADYLYEIADLASLVGRRYAAKRNHIHAFLKEHPDYTYEPLGEGNLEEVRAFYRAFRAEEEDDSPSATAEGDAAARMLDAFLSLGTVGGVLRGQGGEILGFFIGEVRGDVLYLHVEKANRACRGAYPMLVRETARAFAGSVRYENREEDDGDEGLRRSKQSWCPVSLLGKYRVTVRRERTGD